MFTEKKIDSGLDDFDEEIIKVYQKNEKFMKEYHKDQECQKNYMRVDIPVEFHLMHIRAWKYLKKGVWDNQIKDYIEMPDAPFYDEVEFRKGCEQMLEWQGFDINNPFRLSICSMDNLMQNFYFQKIEQEMIKYKTKANGSYDILDRLFYFHRLVDSRITIYNLVQYK